MAYPQISMKTVEDVIGKKQGDTVLNRGAVAAM